MTAPDFTDPPMDEQMLDAMRAAMRKVEIAEKSLERAASEVKIAYRGLAHAIQEVESLRTKIRTMRTAVEPRPKL